MPQVLNPYFAGPPATQPETFFGRQDVLRFVDDTLASPMHNVIVLHGQRRIGKTSILHQIARRMNQDYQAVFFDFQSSVDSPVHDLLYGLAREVSSQLNLPAPKRNNFQQDSETFRADFLPQVYDHLEDRRLLLLLDEFDALSLETAPVELDALPFVQSLNRIIQSEDKQVVFLFVIGRRLKDLSVKQLQIFRGALDRQIALLRQETCRQLIVQPADGILTYEDEAIDHIWSLTSGHPYFTQLICHHIFRQAQHHDGWTVTRPQVDAIIDDAISAGQSALQWFWDEVPVVERFILHTIGQLAANGQGVTLEQLITQRDLQRMQISDIELRTLPDKLVDRQVLRRDSKDNYHFAVELVRRWIIQTHSLEEVTIGLKREGTEEAAKNFLKAGLEAYRNEDLVFAQDSFSRALNVNPDYVEARLWLARTRLKAGDLLGAIDDFAYVERFGGREAREAQVGLADARAQYGQQLEEEGKVEEATREYQRAIKLDKQHDLANSRLSEIFRQQADELLEKEGVEVAQPLYIQAIGHKTNVELERKIKKRLDEYSQAQQEANNWEEAERASRLYAKLLSQTEPLLRVQLAWARWLLSDHEYERATDIYRRILTDATDDAPDQMIENDVLRYAQQEEEEAQWGRVEAALSLLVEIFPDDIESQNRLTDSLCRQGEFHLNQDKITEAQAAYQRALTVTGSDRATAISQIKDGFQTYRRTRQDDKTIRNRKLTAEAMQALVAISNQTDIEAYQWLFEAREAYGDILYQKGKVDRAHETYSLAWDDVTFWIELNTDAEQAYRRRAEIGLKLGQVELDRGAFNEAADCFRQVLIDGNSDPQLANQIKTDLNDYRLRQEKASRWGHAGRAMEALAHLLHGDEEVNFWLAETRAAHADWYLRRAIPDLEAVRRLAREAITGDLTFEQLTIIVGRLKKSFQTYCQQQQKSMPPRWEQAEWAVDSLVGLFPGNVKLQRQLANIRASQGDWYLAQQTQTSEEARQHLTQAAEAYQRALNDFPEDNDLINRLKDSFRNYREQRPDDWPLAHRAIQILTAVLPNDPEIKQWLEETEPEEIKIPLWKRVPIRLAAEVAAILVMGVILVSWLWGGVLFPPTSTPTLTLTSTPGPTKIAVDTPTSTPIPTNTATSTPEIVLSPTEEPVAFVPPTATTKPTAEPTVTPTDTPTVTPTTEFTLDLLNPLNQASFKGAKSLPRLAWAATNDLAPDEYYRVKLTSPNKTEAFYSLPLTNTVWGVPVEVFHWANLLTAEPSLREIAWQVSVFREEEEGNVELATSQTRTFTWEPDPLPDSQALNIAINSNPDDPKEILFALKEDGIHRAEYGGLTWTRVLTDAAVDALHIANADKNIIYVGLFGYVLKSEQGGRADTWQVYSLPGEKFQVYDIVTDPDNPNLVFVATESGILRSDNGGESWLGLEQDENGVVLNKPFYTIAAVKTSVGNRIYAAGKGDQIYRRATDDIGRNTWETLVCSYCSDPIYSLAVTIEDEKEDSIRLYAGSNNGKFSWWSAQEGWHETRPIPVNRLTTPKLTAIVVNESGIVFVGSTDGEGLYRSGDMGQTWEQFDETKNWKSITDIVFYPNNSQVILIAGSEGVAYSDNGGETWTKL